jgi:alpha-beta hydrolase superfamily lysophospholipase
MTHGARYSLGPLALAFTILLSRSVDAREHRDFPVQAQEPSIDAHATDKRSHSLALGRVLASEPLPGELWLPSTGRAYRLQYLSAGMFGLPAVVSGAVFVPEGPAPAAGWPIVSWAHGTVGVADACAPSTMVRSARDIAYLSAWLRAGYAVAATDYRGLGTKGRHPYLDGTTAARDVIDVVRAARRLDSSLSRSWFAVGQSQGAHAALFAASMATAYAPELDFRGTIATAPPTQWRMTITATDAINPALPASPFAIPILAGLETVHRWTFDAAEYLTDLGREIYRDALRAECFSTTAARVAGLLNGAVYDIDAAEEERLIRFLELEDVPIKAYDRPVYIAQGTADRVVYPPASELTANQLHAAGADVTFGVYPGIDHNGVLAAALADLLAWAARVGEEPTKPWWKGAHDARLP